MSIPDDTLATLRALNDLDLGVLACSQGIGLEQLARGVLQGVA